MQTESIAALATALAKAQGQIAPASKDAENPFYKSHYADLASIWEACRGPLSANGLAVIQSPIDAGAGRVGLLTRLVHSSGEWISSEVTVRLAKDDAQGLGSALTYLRRYCLAAFIGVTATEDDDANAAVAPWRQRKQAVPPATPKAKAPLPIPVPIVDSVLASIAGMTLEKFSKAAEFILASEDGGKLTTDEALSLTQRLLGRTDILIGECEDEGLLKQLELDVAASLAHAEIDPFDAEWLRDAISRRLDAMTAIVSQEQQAAGK